MSSAYGCVIHCVGHSVTMKMQTIPTVPACFTAFVVPLMATLPSSWRCPKMNSEASKLGFRMQLPVATPARPWGSSKAP
eukprot:SAG31_NODE_3990_length_3681_cov_2.353992_5_plen_79_part_00